MKKAKFTGSLAFFGISAGSVTYPVIDALLAGDDRPDTDM